MFVLHHCHPRPRSFQLSVLRLTQRLFILIQQRGVRCLRVLNRWASHCIRHFHITALISDVPSPPTFSSRVRSIIQYPIASYSGRSCIAPNGTEQKGNESTFRLLRHFQTIKCPGSCVTEVGNTSVLRTGSFLLYEEKPNRKNANAVTLLARMRYEYVWMKNHGILEYSMNRSISW